MGKPALGQGKAAEGLQMLKPRAALLRGRGHLTGEQQHLPRLGPPLQQLQGLRAGGHPQADAASARMELFHQPGRNGHHQGQGPGPVAICQLEPRR